jgi:hypothetical protein
MRAGIKRRRRLGRQRRLAEQIRRIRHALGAQGLAAAAVLILSVAVAALLDIDRKNRGNVEELVAYAESDGMDPVALVVAAGKAHRILFLGDVHSAAEPKRIAVAAIEALARGPGLDAVVLEVSSAEQPYIDQYLASDPEDASILLAHPRTLRDHWGISREYLEIYRCVWRLNRVLGPERQIRIVAADLPDWPPVRAVGPRDAARQYALRDEHMADLLEREVLSRDPRARVLIFMGGYHGLKQGHAELHLGVGAPVRVDWLGGRLRQKYPGQVYTVVSDGAPEPTQFGAIASYGATRVFDLFRRHLPASRAPFALRVDERFDFVRQPFYEPNGPGMNLDLQPDDYRLRDVVDAYIYLGVARGIERRR